MTKDGLKVVKYKAGDKADKLSKLKQVQPYVAFGILLILTKMLQGQQSQEQ